MTHAETAAGGALAGIFRGFFDDAAIFPPGLAPLEVAVREHLLRRGTPAATATGPLIVGLDELEPTARLAEEHGAGPTDASGPLRISLVAPAARLDDVLAAADALGPAATVVTLELKTSPENERWRDEIAAAASIRDRAVFIELTAEQIEAGALELFDETPLRLKFRTGGIHPQLFPSASQLANALSSTVTAGIPFKLTAGLHEAVRHTNPTTGFTHHGFLNIAVATARALDGAPRAELEEVLLDTDGERLAATFSSLTAAWREYFTAFGTCSITEPIESLERLGLVDTGAAASTNSPTHSEGIENR